MFETSKQSIQTSIKALLANKVRSFLTMLGIIIGVGSVIIIMAVGAGAQSLILSQVKSLGTNLVGVLPGKAEEDGPPATVMGVVITTLSYDDLQEIKKKKNVPNLVEAVGYTKGMAPVNWGSETYDTNISGCTVGYIEVEGGEVDTGRFFTDDEERNMARVIVLGNIVKKELFGDSDAVGQRVRIKKQSFEVIGVMKERGTVAFQNYDDQVFIPLKTMQKLIAGVNHLGMIRIKIDYEENIDQAINDIERTIRENHGIDDSSGKSDDFTVRSAAQALDVITVITDSLKYFLTAMAALSLIVGGIGIMNIMFVSVTERTSEIGLRKAVGANNRNIMSQFLIEAIFITTLGGVIGIIAGGFLSYIIYLVVSKGFGYDWEYVVSLGSIVLAFGVSIFVGMVFGIFPAYKASRLEPIEALRYE